MVCKEEVLLWFKDLEGYARIDVLYELLNMCLPFELRFIGTCIEELGKHSYPELRGLAITTNDLEKLSKDTSLNQGILDETVRHRVLIYLSLLSSRNYNVANWLYRKLLRTEYVEEYLVKEQDKDEMLHSEFLLLYTMALHHPAFTFEQKQFFSRVLSNLIDFKENRISAKHSSLGYPPGFGYPTQKVGDSASHVSVPASKQLQVPPAVAAGDCQPSAPSQVYQPPGLPQLPPLPPHLDFGGGAPTISTAAAPPAQQPTAVPTVWSPRPGFPYGAPPEVPPFPSTVTAAMTPLLTTQQPPPPSTSTSSTTVSPPSSRGSSPHRTGVAPTSVTNTATGAVIPPPPVIANAVPHPQGVEQQLAGLEQLAQSAMYGKDAVLTGTDDVDAVAIGKVTSLEEKHLRDLIWPHHGHGHHQQHLHLTHHPPLHHPPPSMPPPGSATTVDATQLNGGVRFPAFIGGGGKVRPYLVEQMHALQLDGENSSLHRSNSSVGSCSSPEITPPGTPKGQQHQQPPTTPAATIIPVAMVVNAGGQPTTVSTAPLHGPGRGDKARSNGVTFGNGNGNGSNPQQQQQKTQQQEAPSPPPQPQQPQPSPAPPSAAFTNSSVPYSFTQFAQLPPNRSMFHYSQQPPPTTGGPAPPPPSAATGQTVPAPPAAAAAGYRPSPAFTAAAHFPFTDTFPPPTYTFPYVPLMYSSPPTVPGPAPAAAVRPPQPPPGCYNCGSPAHQGTDCPSQNIEEITQKKTYQLEFTPPPLAATAATATDASEK